MIAFGSEPVAAVGTFHAVEIRRRPEFQCPLDVDRDVFRPPFEVPEVYSIEEHAVQERVPCDLLGNIRGNRPDTRCEHTRCAGVVQIGRATTVFVLQYSPSLTSFQPR